VSTSIADYAELNGMVVPVKGEAFWHLSSGDFCYLGARVTDIEYDRPVAHD